MIGMTEILALPVLELLLVSLLCGGVGALALLDEKIFFAESVTHGTFPGAVLGVVVAAGLGAGHAALSVALLSGALLLCLPLGALMRGLERLPGISSQAAAGIVLSSGFALGYVLAKWCAPLPIRIEGFLTGSLLTVDAVDVALAGAGCLALGLVLVARGRAVLHRAFDPVDFAAAGGNARRTEGMLIALVVAAVVLSIPAVGTVLSIALLAAPAAGLAPRMRSLRVFLLAAPIAAVLIGFAGLSVALALDLSVGGTIGIASGLFYAGCRLLPRRIGRAAATSSIARAPMPHERTKVNERAGVRGRTEVTRAGGQ